MKTALKIAAGVVLGGAALAAVLAALLWRGAEAVEGQPAGWYVDPAEVRAIPEGMPRAEVIDRLGSEFDTHPGFDCLLWQAKGEGMESSETWELCFADGRVSSKTRW